jgi:hypothetical protein
VSSSVVISNRGPAVKKIYENPNNGLLSLEMSLNNLTSDRRKSKRRKNKSPGKQTGGGGTFTNGRSSLRNETNSSFVKELER